MTYFSHLLVISFLLLAFAFTVFAAPHEAGVNVPNPQPDPPPHPPPDKQEQAQTQAQTQEQVQEQAQTQEQEEQSWPDDHPHPHSHHNHGHKPQPKPQRKPEPAPPRKKFGISYSPYTSTGTCKTQDQVDHDMAAIAKPQEYSIVRIYGTDCNQTATVSAAARRYSMSVFAGVFDLDGFPGSLDPIIQVGKSSPPSPSSPGGTEGDDNNNNNNDNWSTFHTITIGNELIQKSSDHATAIPSVTAALHKARSILRAAGYRGPVVTVDTYSMLLAHPELCDASDYCAANCHVFFDATQEPRAAGGYARDVARRISRAAGGGKRTVIAESGWPHAGLANGKAVPGVEEQRDAVGSLKKEFGGGGGDEGEDDAGLVLFTAFDDLWKEDNAGTFGAERFWGLH